MAREPDGFDVLVSDLRALAPAVEPGAAEVDAVTAAVLARLGAAPPAPERARGRALPGDVAAWFARRRRRLAVALVVVLLALTGVPAVRAAVADWFGFAGVKVKLTPEPRSSSSPLATPSPPPSVAPGRLAAVRHLVAFVPRLPAALGPPDGVEVSADRKVLSMSWNDPAAGVVRLDEFDGGLDYGFAKTAPGAEYLDVGGYGGLWFEQPHEVVWLLGETSRHDPPRLAGHTLIWEQGGTTLRLEGDLTRERAVAIAESAVPVF